MRLVQTPAQAHGPSMCLDIPIAIPCRPAALPIALGRGAVQHSRAMPPIAHDVLDFDRTPAFMTFKGYHF